MSLSNGPLIPVVLAGALSLFLFGLSAASPLGDSTATTESSCNFGMAKENCEC